MWRPAVFVLVAGCYHPEPPAGAPCAAGDVCPTGLTCIGGVCVTAGGVDAALGADACPAMSCMDSTLVDCSGSHTCANGCASGAEPRCAELVPSNGITPGLLTGATADIVGTGYAFDTVGGQVLMGSVIVRPAGTGVSAGIGFTTIDGMGVFTAHSVTIPSNAMWTAHGSNALVLYAATTIIISGTLDVGAVGATAGPGGVNASLAVPTSACDGGVGRIKMTLNAGAGGGGAGGSTSGGAGGATAADPSGSTPGGAGGAMCGTPSAMPLRGGHAGGAGGTEGTTSIGGHGGGGGGAVGLVAMLNVTVSGTVAASGEGGALQGGGSGGGGGGGGGAVFLESPTVALTGALTANGGGGAPSANSTTIEVTGQRGHLSDALPAAGGSGGAAGGRGGARNSNPGGGATDGSTGGGSGGGGATGIIHIRSAATQMNNDVISPAATMSQPVIQ